MMRIQPSLMLKTVVLGLLLFESCLSRPTFAQQSPCDSDLQQAGNDPYGYRLRGDRCEGIYIKEVAKRTLLVASLTESFEDFNPASSQSVLLGWTAPGSVSIHLRAYSLRHRFYYQMDSLRPAGSTSYVWPMDLLAALKPTRNDLGIVARASLQLGNTKREVYLPLRINRRATTGQSQGYHLVLLPGVELAEVFISLAPVKTDGTVGAFLIDGKALGYGRYTAGRGITISIPKPKTQGIYYLEIGATLRGSGSSTAQVWFYHHTN